jgi:uncharacterized membrane protein
MITLPPTAPPLRRDFGWSRNLPVTVAFKWLAAGWADFRDRPGLSLAYGLAVFVVSIAIVAGLFRLGLDYVLFPALAGFMLTGPVIALGLYEKSRRLQRGEPVGLAAMLFVRPRSGGQVIFTGVLLMLLMLLWMRAAVILYALFFGLLPFSGFADILPVLVFTPAGWALLIVGTLVGGLFAAFSFAISVFSLPMLLDESTDSLTAMGTSMALVWNNLAVMVVWGGIVMMLVTLSLASGLVGLIVVFPVLGHATWHAFRTMRQDPAAKIAIERLDGAGS